MDQDITRKNLTFFREEAKLSKSKLAEELHYGRSTLTEYESGKKPITCEAAERMADYFNIAYVDFVSCDFTEIEKTEMGSYCFYENLSVFLPIAKSDQALENKDFKHTVERHEKLFMEMKTMGSDTFETMRMLNELKTCAQKYSELVQDPACANEATVNYLGLNMFLGVLLRSIQKLMESIDINNVIMNQATENSPISRNDLEGVEESDKKKVTAITELVSGEEFYEAINTLIKAIKQVPEWNDVGDYYLAMRFIWGCVNNDLSLGMNYRIGSEMLAAFADIGNQYAIAVMSL